MTVRFALVLVASALALASPALAQATFDWGDDSGEYARDRECDDRRFTGPGMATVLSWTHTGRDASDCRQLFNAGRVKVWQPRDAQAATQCAAIDWGHDRGPYPNDGECDDIRFEGPGAAQGLSDENTGKDATDCARLCEFGQVFLRDY